MKQEYAITKYKQKYNVSVKLIVFSLLILVCFYKLNNITKRKESFRKTKDFFEQKADFDVLFFGNSHVYTEIYPMQLWKEYGIISYNLGQVKNTIAESYYKLLLSLKETKPRLIVLDNFFLKYNDKILTEDDVSGTIHNTFDPYSLSYTKYLAIKDLFDEKNQLNNIFEYLFYFSTYHSRWKELNETDFCVENLCEKGAATLVHVETPADSPDFNSVDMYSKEENISMVYLRKIIEFCQGNNIEILLTYLPFPAGEEDIAASKYLDKIANEYNVKYLNFLNMNIVNFDTDCYDKDSHLNVSGARKVTNYLGRYIIENYDIPDQRNNKIYDFWEDDYNKYIDFKIHNLRLTESHLDNYLMLLYFEKDIKYDIKISSNYKLEDNIIIKNLLKNIDNNYKVDDNAFINKEDKNICITVYDSRDDRLIRTVWFK